MSRTTATSSFTGRMAKRYGRQVPSKDNSFKFLTLEPTGKGGDVCRDVTSKKKSRSNVSVHSLVAGGDHERREAADRDGPLEARIREILNLMPKIRIHNQTKGTALPNGIVIVVRAGVTDSQGVFEAPKELVVQVGKSVDYDVSSSDAFRIMAEPQNKTMKAANYFPQKGSVKKDIDVFIVASNKDYLEISLDKPGS